MAATQSRSVVRAEGRRARRAVVDSERIAAQRRIVDHLGSLHALCAPSVGVFIAHDGEPDLSELITKIWAAGSTVALPVLNDADHHEPYEMRYVPWHEGEPLHEGRYGIAVPAPTAAIEPATVLVSMTGFDAAGNRIGRGGGFFDRYLAKSAAQIVGVAFETQRFDEIPVEDHDVGLPVIVSDLGVRLIQK